MNILSYKTLKIDKTHKQGGVLMAALHLEPGYSKHVCPYAGECRKTCISKTGHHRFDMSKEARIRRTKEFFDDPTGFAARVHDEIMKLSFKAAKRGLIPVVRLNGTSDIDWHIKYPWLFTHNLMVRFVDYTKDPERYSVNIPNYHLVYSYNENTPPGTVEKWLDAGKSVAVVFTGDKLPVSWVIDGQPYNVVDGDKHDLLYQHSRCIIGLRYKKAFSKQAGRIKAVKPKHGFMQEIMNGSNTQE